MDAATDWVVSGGRYALDFDGIDHLVSVNNGDALNFGNADFAFSGWFFQPSYVNTVAGLAAEDNAGVGNPQWWFRRQNSSGALRFLTGDATGETVAESSNGASLTNQWQHFVARRFGAELAIFVNGGMVASTSGPIRNVSSAQRITIGTFGVNFFNGLADSLMLHNRALSPAEIRTLSTRRGIAFERRKRRPPYIPRTSSLRRKILTGQV